MHEAGLRGHDSSVRVKRVTGVISAVSRDILISLVQQVSVDT